MASTSSFLTVALVVVLLGAANPCHGARRSLAEALPAVPVVPGMTENLVNLLNVVVNILLPVPNSDEPRPEEELVPLFNDLAQELELGIAILEEVRIANLEVITEEKEVLSFADDMMMPALKDLLETLKDLIPSLSSVPAPKQMMPILVELLQELKLLTPSGKDMISLTLTSAMPILKRTMPLFVHQFQEVKLLTAILKMPNSKVVIPENEVTPILMDLLRDLKLLRAVSKLLRPENQLMSNLMDQLRAASG